MTHRITHNKLYLAAVGAQCSMIYLVNNSKAIYQCALFFTLIAIITNIVSAYYGHFKALKGLAFGILINLALSWQQPYFINAKIVHGLTFASLAALGIASYWSVSIFRKSSNKFSFSMANAISMTVASVIDGFVMGAFFILNNHFTFAKVLDIFIREISWKIMYIAIFCLILELYNSKFRLPSGN